MSGGLRMVAAALGLALLLAVAACGSDDKRASLRIELATPTCGETAVPEVACARVVVCPSGTLDDPDRECFPLALPDGKHGDGVSEGLLVPIGADARLAFDGKLDGSRFDVEVVGYDSDDQALLVGRARNIALSKGATLRLYRIGESSCAADDNPLPRAFHEAIRLPNDDVLLVGGVEGEAGMTGGMTRQATFQPSLEVYRSNTGRFEKVRGDAFSRVLFAAFLVPGEAKPYRIRVYGGYEPPPLAEGADPDAPVPALKVGPETTLERKIQSPVAPAETAVAAPPADLVYDPVKRSVRVEPVEDSGVDGAGWAMADHSATPSVAFAIPFDAACWSAGNEDPPCTPASVFELDAAAGLDAAGAGRAVGAARLGATLTAIDDQILVWGGPVTRADTTRNMLAGALLGVNNGPVDSITDATPTALHTATPLTSTAVLTVGGLTSGCIEGCGTNTVVTAELASTPIRLLDVSMGPVVPSAPVPDAIASYTASIFHSATSLTIGETRGVLVVGGMGGEPIYSTVGLPQVVFIRSEGASVVIDDMGGRVPSELRTGRWGHTATPLPDDRVLIVGGFAAEEGSSGSMPVVQALATGETLSLAARPEAISACLSGDEAGGG